MENINETKGNKEVGKNILNRILIFLASLVIFSIVGGFCFWLLFVNYVQQYEFPYSFNKLTGEVKGLNHTGFIVTRPWIAVYGIDTRPHQVMIQVGTINGDSANKRILNAKLVSFVPDGLNEFIKLHGPQNGNISEILKIYAYDQEGRNFPFLKVETQSVSGKENSQ